MSSLSSILLAWYARCGRDLPWRRTRDPYLIWLSEVILQQTRVAQGWEYYERFAARFPDVQSLAAASQDEVLKLWQGLGYYSRARNLHAAARQIVECFGGRFPHDPADVRSLRGVGDYTAAAICSAAYDLPMAVVDGNVFRVLSRIYDLDAPIDTAAGRRLFARLADELLDRTAPGACNQAIMDFGALVCTPAAPRCGECPLSDRCRAREAGTVDCRPVKQGRAVVRDRWFHYLHLLDATGEGTWLCRRESDDIWRGLYEFPMIETDRATDFAALVSDPRFGRWMEGCVWQRLKSLSWPVHKLSHRQIHATFHQIVVTEGRPCVEGALYVAAADLGDYAVPRLIESYLDQYAAGTAGRRRWRE